MRPFPLIWILAVFVLAGLMPAAAQDTTFTLYHDGVVTWADWSPDGAAILTTAEDGAARLWDAQTGALLSTYPHDVPVRGGAWHSDSRHFLTWAEGGAARIWAVDSLTPQQTFAHGDSLRGGRWSPDEAQILTWGGTSAILWSDDGTSLVTLTREAQITQAEWSADGAHLHIFSGTTGSIHDAATGDLLASRDFGYGTLGAAWSRDESRVATWTLNYGVQIWDADSDTPISLLHRTFVTGTAFTKDESHVLAWSGDDTAKLWDITARRIRLSLNHIDWVQGALFNADESLILTWAYNGVHLWQADGTPFAIFNHDMLVTGARFSADESQILSWGWDDTARVWQTP